MAEKGRYNEALDAVPAAFKKGPHKRGMQQDPKRASPPKKLGPQSDNPKKMNYFNNKTNMQEDPMSPQPSQDLELSL